MDARQPAGPRGPGFEYRYLTEFQSHEPEFDYLKSLEIEEKINRVQWVRSSQGSKHVLSTNDKTIKLWKVGSPPRPPGQQGGWGALSGHARGGGARWCAGPAAHRLSAASSSPLAPCVPCRHCPSP